METLQSQCSYQNHTWSLQHCQGQYCSLMSIWKCLVKMEVCAKKNRSNWWLYPPHVKECVTVNSGFHSVDYWILCQTNLDSQVQSLVGFQIPWTVFWIPKARVPDSTSKTFLDFTTRILEPGFPYKGWILDSVFLTSTKQFRQDQAVKAPSRNLFSLLNRYNNLKGYLFQFSCWFL